MIVNVYSQTHVAVVKVDIGYKALLTATTFATSLAIVN